MSDTLPALVQGFGIALQPVNLMLALGGVLTGTIVGMLPGIGPINAIAILIPIIFTAGLAPESALILLAGIYYGSQYGNSISTILLNVPGTASSVVTALDGYEMTRNGQAGPALAISAISSFVGGTLSIFGLILFAPLLSGWAIRFGPAEYFALMAFAFAALSGLAGRSLAKGLIATALGLFLATVGLDPQSAVPRFTFGQLQLFDGLDFVVVTIGLFALSEVLELAVSTDPAKGVAATVHRVRIEVRDTLATGWTMVRSSVLGFLVGVLPGAGGTIASFLAYSVEKQVAGTGGGQIADRRSPIADDPRRSGDAGAGEATSTTQPSGDPAAEVPRDGSAIRDPRSANEEARVARLFPGFGRGDLRGVAAPEAANNAAATGAMIPLLTLGVPGSGTTAVLLGALLGMNVAPGPLLIERSPGIFWGLAASMYIGNLFLLLLNLPLVGMFVRVLRLPRWILVPGVAALSFVAVYAVNGSSFDLALAVGFGLAGFAMRRLGIPLAPVILGLVLGPLLEKNLRRSLALSGGDWSVLFSSNLALVLWALAALSLVAPVALRRLGTRPDPAQGEID